MKRGTMWPVGIVAVLATTMAANFWVLYVAGHDPSFAIEKDYYRKAVQWDSTMAQARANATLGWRVEPAVSPIAPDGAARVVVRLRDAQGAPLAGARVRVAALHNARAGHVLEGALAPAGGEGYAITLPLARHGQWELRFDVTRGGQHFTAVERVDVAAARRSGT